ncbi:MAG: antibiotic biosynthesis monooxygenase, partial [Chloroflexota bacterium]
ALGYFTDENAVKAWRNHPQHREAQKLGRELYFDDYRLCMAEVIRDYSMIRREQIPSDSYHFHSVITHQTHESQEKENTHV